MAGHVGSYVAIRKANIGVPVFKIWGKDRFDNIGTRQTDCFISLIPVGEIQDIAKNDAGSRERFERYTEVSGYR